MESPQDIPVTDSLIHTDAGREGFVPTFAGANLIGLARMAMQLAEERGPGRLSGYWSSLGLPPADREPAFSRPKDYPISCEYYRIIDRLSRGEAP
jgi:hypothetical protein